jgi:hypothetical protein
MAATSTTGVGPGSADGLNKGSEHMTLGSEKLIGPRVVIASDGTLDGSGDLVTVYPVLSGAVTDYIAMAVDADTTAAAAVAISMAMDTTSTTLTLKGPASGVVNYSVIKKGLAV